MFAMLGYQDIVVILIIALLLFGPNKLPEIGKQVGNLMREFRNMTGDMQRALDLEGHNHYEYDRGYNHRAVPEYDYKNGNTGTVDHDDEVKFIEDDTKFIESFSYSAPTSGTPVAATSMVAADAVTEESSVETHQLEAGTPHETHETSVGARVYTEPDAPNAEKVTLSPAATKEQELV